LSYSESSFLPEGDASPPSARARRRFSALMDTHRFASPLEVDGELQVPSRQQQQMKTRGASLEGAMGVAAAAASSCSQGDLRSTVKEGGGGGGGRGREMMSPLIHG